VTAALIDRLLPAEGPEPGPPADPVPIDTRRFAGAYANNLGCFTCEEGEGWPIGHFRIEAPERGVLRSESRWLAIDSLLFQREDGSKLAFLEDSSGAIRYAASGPNSFVRLDDRLLDQILGPGWADRPPTSLVAIVHRANERWPEAARAYESLAGRHPDRGRLHFYAGFSRLNAGQPDRAIPSLERALELGQWRGWSQYYIAGALAAQGEREAALDALEWALDLRFNDRNLLERDPWWGPLRDDPRFVELVGRLGAMR
jgi:tetratricopeptide (TPR) repeat protein